MYGGGTEYLLYIPSTGVERRVSLPSVAHHGVAADSGVHDLGQYTPG